MRTHILKPLLILAAAALGACDGGTNLPPVEDEVGRVAFTYSVAGVQSGARFTVEGAKPAAGPSGTWAASTTDDMDAVVYAQREQGTIHDQIVLSIPGGTATTSSIVPDCDESCAYVSFRMEKAVGGVERAYVCEITQGTISVLTFSETRMRGTFSGTGNCSSPGVEGEPAFSVTGGTFDTPLADHI
ncbi:hypothetical protein [Longimicrobium terrae]|uniref:Lipoprotein n=1 Tax=Longimicrobium terrae TaxID=1639882 RepID=A0A841GYK1_9BACT|nr:hypothetical protein [Longimicrobium terrae]MBB4636611.1 hypothetical protein [Longimicrobium terrae]MBB6070865.1 hypothetical protein [Longimicrobium terrae]NNC28890.1 hypothetical protein [Longimicrobium terrae]